MDYFEGNLLVLYCLGNIDWIFDMGVGYGIW